MKNYFRNNIFLLLMFFSAAFTLKAGVWSFSTGKGVHLINVFLFTESSGKCNKITL